MAQLTPLELLTLRRAAGRRVPGRRVPGRVGDGDEPGGADAAAGLVWGYVTEAGLGFS